MVTDNENPKLNPQEPSDKGVPLDSNEEENELPDKALGVIESLPNRTTYDLQDVAREALDMTESKDEDNLLSEITEDIKLAAQQALNMTTAPSPEKVLLDARQSDSVSSQFSETMRLKITFSQSEITSVYKIAKESIVGRGDAISEYTPQIDLTNYGAYRLGISRKHAKIIFNGTHLEIIDLGSRNGTKINGKTLIANKAYILHSGDDVQFGNMSTNIEFIDADTEE